VPNEGDAEVAWVELPPRGGWAAIEERLRSLTGGSRVVVIRVPASLDDAAAPGDVPTRERVFARLASPDTVFVALVDAPCAGGALAMALSCDLILADENAEFSFSPGELFGSLARFARTVGHTRALELCLTGRRVPAVEAAALGLVNLVVAAGLVVYAVDYLAAALLATPREVATEAKRALLATSSEKELSGKISLSEELAAIVRLAGDDEVNRER
jgi:enoyl-CoA hydratase/carnithine racemase